LHFVAKVLCAVDNFGQLQFGLWFTSLSTIFILFFFFSVPSGLTLSCFLSGAFGRWLRKQLVGIFTHQLPDCRKISLKQWLEGVTCCHWQLPASSISPKPLPNLMIGGGLERQRCVYVTFAWLRTKFGCMKNARLLPLFDLLAYNLKGSVMCIYTWPQDTGSRACWALELQCTNYEGLAQRQRERLLGTEA